MYCIYCGVKLREGETECPLCHTVMPVPVSSAEGEGARRTGLPYSDRYPGKEKEAGKYIVLGLITVILIAASLACLIVCLKTTGGAGWGGIAALGMALGWIWFILPWFFPRWRPMIFLPVDFACAAGYLLYICGKTGGSWFLSFAFPVTMIVAVLTLAGVAMMRYIVQGRLRLMSLLVIVIGLSFMLVELFQHITFGTPMFAWSLYCVSVFCLFGLFLFIASFVPPLRAFLRRKFFF